MHLHCPSHRIQVPTRLMHFVASCILGPASAEAISSFQWHGNFSSATGLLGEELDEALAVQCDHRRALIWPTHQMQPTISNMRYGSDLPILSSWSVVLGLHARLKGFQSGSQSCRAPDFDIWRPSAPPPPPPPPPPPRGVYIHRCHQQTASQYAAIAMR